MQNHKAFSKYNEVPIPINDPIMITKLLPVREYPTTLRPFLHNKNPPSFEKGLNGQNLSSPDSHYPVKKSIQQNFPFPSQLGEISSYPLTLFG